MWVQDSTSTKRLERTVKPCALSVSPRFVRFDNAVQGDVVHRVFRLLNRGEGSARFKVFLADITPHSPRHNHALVHYSPAGVTAYPNIPTSFTVSFYANAVGAYTNTLVIKAQTQEIRLKFRANVVAPVSVY